MRNKAKTPKGGRVTAKKSVMVEEDVSGSSSGGAAARGGEVYVADDFDLCRPIDVSSDVCAMCKQGQDFGVLMQRVLPNISDTGLQHVDGLLEDEDVAASASSSLSASASLSPSNDSMAGQQQAAKKKHKKGTSNTATGSRDQQPPQDLQSDQASPLDPEMVWVSRYALACSRRVFVHFYCALYSPRTWFTGSKWHNVTKEVTRSSSFVCSFCKQRGATIGCYEVRCNVVMHFPCAVKSGYQIYRYSNVFMCPEHSEFQRYLDSGLICDDLSKSDISRGKEPIPVSIEDSNIESSHSFQGNNYNKEFSYVNFNVDSDTIIGNGRNVDELECCKCEDMCDDAELCNCLKNGRQYTYQGMLINPSSSTRLLECNIKCNCSYRRCTNRVVERGLTFELQIFRLNCETTSGVKYGVRTLNFIPQYSFVCQVNGQLTTLEKDQRKDRDMTGIIRISKWEETEVEPQLFDDKICLDCKRFGNVGVFIRRSKNETSPMLIHKLVYNSFNKGTIPKLALFAAKNIEANTELLL